MLAICMSHNILNFDIARTVEKQDMLLNSNLPEIPRFCNRTVGQVGKLPLFSGKLS